jgi:hypothetical protein
MADRAQTYKNHVAIFPLFHYFVAPILLINVFVEAWRLYSGGVTASSVWALIVAVALLGVAFSARLMAVTVQDRVIRLEMRLRLAQCLPTDLRARINDLSRQQLVGLRFASDAELAELVREVLDGRLTTPKEIKLRVKNWQPDWLRA